MSDARYWIETVLTGSALARQLGITVAAVEKDRVVLRLPFKPENITVDAIVHGGVIATLIDVAGAAACVSGIGDGEASGGATSSMTISYLAAARSADLTAEAEIIQRSRSQTVTDVFVRDGHGRLVAKGMATSRIFTAR